MLLIVETLLRGQKMSFVFRIVIFTTLRDVTVIKRQKIAAESYFKKAKT